LEVQLQIVRIGVEILHQDSFAELIPNEARGIGIEPVGSRTTFFPVYGKNDEDNRYS
jgi:hypothetical protein